MTALTSHYRNPAALAFGCPDCGADPGTNCFGDSADRDGRYQHFIHAARLALLEMPDSREEWERRAGAIRRAMGTTETEVTTEVTLHCEVHAPSGTDPVGLAVARLETAHPGEAGYITDIELVELAEGD
jgi:hypothetical protein